MAALNSTRPWLVRPVTGQVRDVLTRAEYGPTLVTGDGLLGYDENAEYDRLIATCSVRSIPFSWMWQVRDGGTITAPLSGWMGGSAFAHLTLDDDGTASGRFLKDDISFMTARPHGPPPMPSAYLVTGDARESRVDGPPTRAAAAVGRGRARRPDLAGSRVSAPVDVRSHSHRGASVRLAG